MKKIETISITKIKQLMQNAEKVFDIVRLVDSDHTSVISFTEDGIVQTKKEPCFKVWNKEERCENCISLGACIREKRLTKFEYRDEEMYSVIAMPFIIKDGEREYRIAMELVNRVADDIEVQTDSETIKQSTMDLINYKVYRDSLTGAYNRRYYDERAFIERMRIKKHDRVGLIMIDINRFKHVNDYYGHSCGDELLYHVASVLMSGVRSTDSVIRIGGDEFLVVLSNCSESFVEQKMEELRHLVSEIQLDWLEEIHPSIAAGMSFAEKYDNTEEQLKVLAKEADQKMYANKNQSVQVKRAMLLVDDIEMNRAVLREYFGTEFEIFEAVDGLEGLQILQESDSEIVIADINMPNMNGIDMIKEIRKDPERSKTIIVAVTDRGEQWEREALEAGADDFINKPFHLELLNQRIRGLLLQN